MRRECLFGGSAYAEGMLVRRECLLEGALIFVGSAYAEGVLVPRECLCGGSGYTER